MALGSRLGTQQPLFFSNCDRRCEDGLQKILPNRRQVDGRSVLPGLVSSVCALLMGAVPNICYTVLEPVCLEPFGDAHEQ